ncbi:MAG TPA: SMR family transporter [Burkholderiales bacterium]|nr:SMR family transporter [Burkholderiales bacterium]
MNAASFSLILAGVVLNAGAQLLLKAGAVRVGPLDLHLGRLASAAVELASSGPILAGLACYGVSVVLWIAALTRVEVSLAYPMLSIGYVINAIAAWMLFGESLNGMRVAGIGVIIVGVFLLARSGHGA